MTKLEDIAAYLHGGSHKTLLGKGVNTMPVACEEALFPRRRRGRLRIIEGSILPR
jgi:hypothetical protein